MVQRVLGFARLVALCVVLGIAFGGAVPAAAAAADPGLLLELDLDSYRLSMTDLRSGESGPPIRVAIGSPSHPTPRGGYPLGRVILNPAWHPSVAARAAGAHAIPASLESPMGVAKIPFADGGSIALHGAGDPLLLGKSVSGGCVRAADADLLRVLAWLHRHGALGLPTPRAGGEVHRSFRRTARLVVQ